MGKQEDVAAMEKLQEVGWSFNARKRFNDFLNSITTNDGLTKECEKIYKILDDIVLGKKADQFKKNIKAGE